MSRKKKIKEKFLKQEKDFTYDELAALLHTLGFQELKGGHTSGSAVCFVHLKTGITIRFHKPHPDKIIKTYLMKQIKTVLEKEGLL